MALYHSSMYKYIILFLLHFSLCCHAQQYSSKTEIYAFLKTINEKHYSPKPMDDVWSEKLFYNFIKDTDESHLYFLKSEIQHLSSDKFNIDNELKIRNLLFVEKVAPIYRASLLRSQKILEKLKSKPWHLAADEQYIPYHKDSMNYAETEAELLLRWERYIKLQVLLKEYQINMDSTADKPIRQTLYYKTLDKNLLNVTNDLMQNKLNSKHLYYLLAKNIPPLFDAHSTYMSYNDFQNFQSTTSTEDYEFGITLQQNKTGQIEIARVSPGSSAWKSNKFNKGDVITHLQWHLQPKIDVSELELEDVLSLLDYSNNLYLTFTTKSATGVMQRISIKKEKSTSDENFVNGYIMQGNDNKKFGYISLPSFYTLYESENRLGCANDVARELIKLKKEQISGLIFDLRNNGGGSLKEGIELSGIFINEGPMMIQKLREGLPQVLKDWNRGTAYDGPMVIMINGHSASASELMASTMQDFNAAVIVGTNSYGKATGQEMLQINPLNSTRVDSLKSGFASITMMKLYRVTGKSNQIRGVQPDIYLPDPFINLYSKEANEPEALPNDSVVKKVYYQPLPALPIANLKRKSTERIIGNEKLNKLSTLSNQSTCLFDPFNQTIPLQSATIKKQYHKHNEWLKLVSENIKVKSKLYKVNAIKSENALLQISEDERLQAQYSIDRIINDIFIEESFLILGDLINNK